MSDPKSYQRMSLAAKRRLDIERVRERTVICPRCEGQLMPGDLLAHMDTRCSGPREPGPRARWISKGKAAAFVTRERLDAWCARGLVRVREVDGGEQLLLERDFANAVAWTRTLEGK